MKTFNNTDFPMSKIMALPIIGNTISKWRQRTIQLREHPTDRSRLISLGKSFVKSPNQQMVIADEERSAWATALEYIANGKVYISE